MFRSRLFRFSLGLFACAGLLALIIFDVDKNAVIKYRNLIASSNPKELAGFDEPEVGRQQRKGVEKNIWFVDAHQRLQVRLQSDQSELQFVVYDNETEVIETLENVRCAIQESLYYVLSDGREAIPQPDGRLLIRDSNPDEPSNWLSADDPALQPKPMQRIRYFEADIGTHNYTTNVFVAEQVTISGFVAPGHKFSEKKGLTKEEPLMKGLAKSIQFTLGGKDIHFQARNFKASFFSQEDLF